LLPTGQAKNRKLILARPAHRRLRRNAKVTRNGFPPNQGPQRFSARACRHCLPSNQPCFGRGSWIEPRDGAEQVQNATFLVLFLAGFAPVFELSASTSTRLVELARLYMHGKAA
jgi:hypothetical protein